MSNPANSSRRSPWGHGVAMLLLLSLAGLVACQASGPSRIETLVADEAKKVAIQGKNLKNPVPDTPQDAEVGKQHFQHHCGVCHGLDGHNAGVPFAEKMSPPVADLGEKDVQDYSDGQLKIIIQNGIRFTGMPGWKGLLDDDEMWHVVRFLRHLPAKGSQGVPSIYKEEEEEHQRMEHGGGGTAPPAQPHQHHGHPH